MAEIPSLTEAYTIIILIAPGFITFRLFTWRASYEFIFSDLQTTLFSLISSVIVFIPFSAIWNFSSIQNLESQILRADIISSYFVLAVGIGFGAGEILHRTSRKSISTGSVWVNFAITNVGDWVRVYTSDGRIYRGWIKQISSHDIHKRELELGDPKYLKDNQWKRSGKSIFFTENNIARIVLLDIEKTKTDVITNDRLETTS